MLSIHKFNNAESTADALAKAVANNLEQALKSNGRATLAVSGGNTPVPFFKALSNIDLNWKNVTITLVDDRWVDKTDDASNEKLVETHLLKNYAATAKFVGLKTEHASPFDGTEAVNQKLKAEIHFPIDVLILGMGDDGHTASLFPKANNLLEGLNLNSGLYAIGMTPLTAPHDRITLTLPVIVNAEHLYLHLSGEKKVDVLKEAEKGRDPIEMPIRAVLHSANVDCYYSE